MLATLRHIAGADLAARLPELMRWLRAADAEPRLADLWESLVIYLVRAGLSVEEGDVRAALELKFGAAGLGLMPSARAIDDVDQLRRIQTALRTAVTLDDVGRLLH